MRNQFCILFLFCVVSAYVQRICEIRKVCRYLRMKLCIGAEVFVLVCVCAAFSTAAAKGHILQHLDDVEGVIRQSYQSVLRREDLTGTGCECIHYDCGCCLHLDIEKVKVHGTGCVNISYLPDQYGISVVFTLDKHVLINVTVSVKNPPPICFGIPHLKKEASLCIDFYNLDYSNKTFSGCIKLEARLLHVFVESVDLGCFHIPLDSKQSERAARELVRALKLSKKLSN